MGSHPDLRRQLDRLEERRVALLDSLAAVDEARLASAPSADGWSVLQVLGHLTLAEELSLRYLRKKIQASPEDVPRAGLVSALRVAALVAALRSPVRFSAPAGTDNPASDVGLAEARARWDEVRAGWAALLDDFPPALLERAVFRHPLAGRMGMAHTFVFLKEHFLHHERQIDRLLRETQP